MSKARNKSNSTKARPGENPAGGPATKSPTPKWMLPVSETLSLQEARDRMAWVAALYDDKTLLKIAKATRFKDGCDNSIIKEFLVIVGCWYLERKDDRDPMASFAANKVELRKIASLAKKLETALEEMSEVSAISLWQPFQHLTMMVHPNVPSGHVTDFGLTITKRSHADGAFEMQHLRPHQIEEAIRVLQRLAEQAAIALPEQKGGQRQFIGLQNWVSSAQYFWRAHSLLAFDPRSAALDFCYLAFKQLDGNVSRQQLGSAMRAANKMRPASKKPRS
jgi:hypothetical protein